MGGRDGLEADIAKKIDREGGLINVAWLVGDEEDGDARREMIGQD